MDLEVINYQIFMRGSLIITNGYWMDYKINFMASGAEINDIHAVTGTVIKNLMSLYRCTYYDKIHTK